MPCNLLSARAMRAFVWLVFLPLAYDGAYDVERLTNGFMGGVDRLQPLAAVFVFVDLEGCALLPRKAGNDALAVVGTAFFCVYKNDAAIRVGSGVAVRRSHGITPHAQRKGAGAMPFGAG